MKPGDKVQRSNSNIGLEFHAVKNESTGCTGEAAVMMSLGGGEDKIELILEMWRVREIIKALQGWLKENEVS